MIPDKKTNMSQPSPSMSPTGELHHIMEESFEDAVMDTYSGVVLNDSSNDTK
jgi:hypothetical protein